MNTFRQRIQLFLLLNFLLIGVALSSEENQAITNEVTIIKPWPPATSRNPAVTDLHNEYNNIFLHGNRNAASHLWATFLLERAPQMSASRLELFFQGFCSISGSPVRPSDYTRYRVTLPLVNTPSKLTGFMYYCCWPCICDTQDFIRVDTLTIMDKDGPRTQNFAVIGNPCDDPEKLQEPFVQPFQGKRKTTLAETAQEVRCGKGGVLEGATVSDNGYIIIGMFFDAVEVKNEVDESSSNKHLSVHRTVDDPTPGRISNASLFGKSVNFHDETEWVGSCSDRARDGYNSGMGEIFRKVCSISPIIPMPAPESEPVHLSNNLTQ